MERLVSKMHNQRVGDETIQEWLFKMDDGRFRLDHYTSAFGGRETSRMLTEFESEEVRYIHFAGDPYQTEARERQNIHDSLVLSGYLKA